MAETMLAATANSTSLHFSLNHICRKHNLLFTMEHVEGCKEISVYSYIRRYARELKDRNIRDWEAEERMQAITEFAACIADEVPAGIQAGSVSSDPAVPKVLEDWEEAVKALPERESD
jgi:hypothetical protein